MANSMARATTSFDTALVLLPPPPIAKLVDTLRSANDKSYPRWSAHITILFPFAPVDDNQVLVNTLRTAFATSGLQPFRIKLDAVGRFATRDYETVYLGTSAPHESRSLWNVVVDALGRGRDGRQYIPHMTLGQTARNADSIAFLSEKGKKLLQHDLSWQVDSVAVLRKRVDQGGFMELYAQIPIGNTIISPRIHEIAATSTFHFNGTTWTSTNPLSCQHSYFTLATYNVLHDSQLQSEYRFEAIRDAVLESTADIIFLQEVADEFLSSILSDPSIRERFRLCSRDASAVLESERNIVLLAREEFGFEWVRVELGGRHKAAVIASFRTPHGTVVISGVHLSAGLASPLMVKKREEMSNLMAYLRRHHQDDQWIIVGDFNWPDSEPFPFADEVTDVWSMGGGETYDPTTNTLAAVTARENRIPQRYDRIFIKRDGSLSVPLEDLGLFGLGNSSTSPGSDHWGLKAVVHIASSCQPCPPPSIEGVSTTPLSLIPTSLSDVELHDLCAQESCLPTEAQNAAFANALESLRVFLSTSLSSPPPDGDISAGPSTPISAVRLLVTPVGSYAMGYHNPGSDIDCVIVGNINPDTFWSFVRSKIPTEAGRVRSIRLRRFVKDATVQMMELDIQGVKIDLQYCPAGKLIECWAKLPDIPRDSPLFALPGSALRTLNAHRDVLALRKSLPSLDNFHLSHRALKLFLSHHGITGARFGYLGGFHLAFLLARVCMLLPPSATPAQIIRVFFHMYSRWNWDCDMVTVPIPGRGEATYRRSLGREPMVILSIEKPSVNVTINSNPHSLRVVKEVFSAADDALEAEKSWKDICAGHTGDTPLLRFLGEHKAFVKIEVSYWGSSCMKGRALIGWLESRFVNLLVQLHAQAPLVRCQLWPDRFCDGNKVDHQGLDGFYLIGLTSLNPVSSGAEDKQLIRKRKADIMNSIRTTLHSFENVIQKNTRYYDPVETFVSITNISSSQLPSAVVLDAHNWSDGGFDDEDEAGEEEGDEDEDALADDFTGSIGPSVRKQKHDKTTTPHLPAMKLRTSSDVYNRLMWDPSVSSGDYVIGYEDRFKGVKETPLGAWKREVEDEAFIPFHRVVHFRRKSDNVVVWDRKTKKDLVFGSGVQAKE